MTLAPAVPLVLGEGFSGRPAYQWWGYPFGWLYPREVLYLNPPPTSNTPLYPSRIYAVESGTVYEVLWAGLLGNIALWSMLAATLISVNDYLRARFRRGKQRRLRSVWIHAYGFEG